MRKFLWKFRNIFNQRWDYICPFWDLQKESVSPYLLTPEVKDEGEMGEPEEKTEAQVSQALFVPRFEVILK